MAEASPIAISPISPATTEESQLTLVGTQVDFEQTQVETQVVDAKSTGLAAKVVEDVIVQVTLEKVTTVEVQVDEEGEKVQEPVGSCFEEEVEATQILEDAAVDRDEAASKPTRSAPASPKLKKAATTPAGPVATPVVAPAKRQRTIFEMMGKAPASDAPPAEGKIVKKQRTSVTTSKSKVVAENGKEEKGSTLQPLNSIPFSMSAFQASLSEEQKKLLQLECDTMGKSWLKVLANEIKKPYFIQLKKFLWDEGARWPEEPNAGKLKVYPPAKDIYTWSQYPLGRVRVVIIGQDPYHGAGQAHGLSFSVPRGVTVPPSLRNIYTEIKAEYPGFEKPKHGNLIKWAEAGVLMLNTALTVRASAAGSHRKRGWEEFTDKVVDAASKYGGSSFGGVGRGCVFMAWGAWAQERVSKLDKTKHLILTSPHPSPMSVHKGFFGNGHFRKANDWLRTQYGEEAVIDWTTME